MCTPVQTGHFIVPRSKMFNGLTGHKTKRRKYHERDSLAFSLVKLSIDRS